MSNIINIKINLIKILTKERTNERRFVRRYLNNKILITCVTSTVFFLAPGGTGYP